MKNEFEVVREVSQRLDGAGIGYMLTGSMAMNYYAQPRMTRDIDLVVAISAADVDKVFRLFHPDYYIARQAVEDSLAHESVFNVIDQESVIKVDCIIRKSSPYRIAEFERRKRVILQGFPTFIVSKEDLMISKLDWAKDSHSEMQLRDVKNLAATGYDGQYVDHWTKSLGLASLWDACKA